MKFIEKGEEDKAREILDAVQEKIPEDVIPQYHSLMTLQMGRLLFELGDTAEYKKRIDNVLGKDDLDQRTIMQITQELVYTLGEYDKAEAILLPMYRQDPYNNWVAGTLVRLYRDSGNYTAALNILDGWLKIAPNDNQARSLRAQIEALANE
jgi:tetratricopeptide (TPR) repeat protein